jgi:hypothetical protein
VVDHDRVDAGARERLDLPDDQRLAAGFEQRFRAVSVSGRIRSPRPAAKIIAVVRVVLMFGRSCGAQNV